MNAEILRLEQTTQFTATLKGGLSAPKAQTHGRPYANRARLQSASDLGTATIPVSGQRDMHEDDLEMKSVSVTAFMDNREAHVVTIDHAKQRADGDMV